MAEMYGGQVEPQPRMAYREDDDDEYRRRKRENNSSQTFKYAVVAILLLKLGLILFIVWMLVCGDNAVAPDSISGFCPGGGNEGNGTTT